MELVDAQEPARELREPRRQQTRGTGPEGGTSHRNLFWGTTDMGKERGREGEGEGAGAGAGGGEGEGEREREGARRKRKSRATSDRVSKLLHFGSLSVSLQN